MAGDNYASLVTSVEITYNIDGQEKNTSLIVKINSKQPMEADFNEMVNTMFVKEMKFLSETTPLLNDQLRKAGRPSLPVAGCYHGDMNVLDELIFLEDLR